MSTRRTARQVLETLLGPDEAAQMLAKAAAASSGGVEMDELQLRERLHLEKFDHSTDPPRLVEYAIYENGRCVSRTTYETEGEDHAAAP